MRSVSGVSIAWYDGLENYMSVAESSEPVLADFFTVRNWDFIRSIYSAIPCEDDVHLNECGFEFNETKVVLYTAEGKTEIAKYDFFILVSRLYDVLIEGANEEHHTVRYETWWQDFIENFFLLQERCKIEMLHHEEEIVTLTIVTQ
ncbi:MAG: hypothetical protein PF439_10395 [Helicobacteraceae bacterium]|nr:hypothetical protein [Helicobacteraceae bacterium]